MNINYLALAVALSLFSGSGYAENTVSKEDFLDTIFEMSSAEELCAAFVEQGYVEERGCVDKLTKADKQCRNKVSGMFPGDMVEGEGTELLGQILLCRASLLKGLDFPPEDS